MQQFNMQNIKENRLTIKNQEIIVKLRKNQPDIGFSG